MNTKIINLSSMGQSADGYIHLFDSNVIYLIDKASSIVIDGGKSVKITDILTNEKIDITIEDGAYVEYNIINSFNTSRNFSNKGTLLIDEVSLDKTTEELNAYLLNEAASIKYNVLSFAKEINQSFKQNVVHNAKYTESDISNYGIALKSNILFDVVGKIEKGMAKSNCHQLSHGVIMDDDSKIQADPILLIDEYDCFANHGAAIGKMSDNDLFYLMSRGLSKQEALLLIIGGIVRPFIDRIIIDEYKEVINNKIEKLIEEA